VNITCWFEACQQLLSPLQLLLLLLLLLLFPLLLLQAQLLTITPRFRVSSVTRIGSVGSTGSESKGWIQLLCLQGSSATHSKHCTFTPGNMQSVRGLLHSLVKQPTSLLSVATAS
jgi:hypothetical protein